LLKVIFAFRKTRSASFSIENYFETLRPFLPEEVAKKYIALYRRLVPEDNK